MKTKFRAWHTHKQIMCDVIRIDFEQEIVTLDLETDDDEYFWIETDWSFSDVEIMQSTGLEDKNGVEIFEGDIMSLKYPRDRRYKVVAKVVNGQEISAMVLKFDNDFTTEEFPLYKISAENNLEIIGNIYENLELLEVAE